MAVVYLSSVAGNDANGGTSITDAKASAQAALTAAGAGGRVWTDPAHNEVLTAATTLTSPGTATDQTEWLCAGVWQNNPTSIGTGARVEVTGQNLTLAGFCFADGIELAIGGSSNRQLVFGSSAPFWWRIDNGFLNVASTGASCEIRVGIVNSNSDDFLLELNNTRVKFAAVGQKITICAPFKWSRTANAIDSAGSAPTVAMQFISTGNSADMVELQGLDMSHLTTGKALLDVSSGNHGRVTTRQVRLGSGGALTTGTVAGQGGVELISMATSASADPNQFYYQGYQGSIAKSVTNYRTGGANAGGENFSYKMTSLAGKAKWYSPLKFAFPFAVFIDTTASPKTVIVPFIHDSLTDILNSDIHIEATHMGNASYPLGALVTDGIATLITAGTAQDANSDAWTTSGITNVRKQECSVTFTNQLKGPVLINVHLEKPNYTVWVDAPRVA